ncbi:MAG TPA: Holliday junction branch migration protein RuvA [Thermoanaerobaculia bacterium]|nr:Holliday junction branch migration protein RuvA [Thermoanaerobaculia bacterium]
MIARLSGTVLDLRTDRLVLDVGGVGYDLAIPLGTFSALPPAGEKAVLHVHTHVREDAILLFGFATPQEKYVFERLISVSGIGPKVALTVLSGLPLPDLVRAIATQNARVLATIPGVGKKLAERLGLELKEKLAGFGAGAGAPSGGKASAVEDAIGALENLGYKLAQAEQAVEKAVRDVGVDDLNKILQAALKSLAR